MNFLSLNEFLEFLTKLGKREGVTSETYSAGALSRGGGVFPKRARPRLEQTKGYAMRAVDLAMDGRDSATSAHAGGDYSTRRCPLRPSQRTCELEAGS